MKRKSWLQWSMFLVGCVLVPARGAGWAQTQSDVSLPELARQHASKKAVMVVDDDALRKYKAAHGIPETVTPAPAPGAVDGDAEASAKPAARPSGKGLTVKGLLQNGTLDQARQLLNGLKKDQEKLLTRYEWLRQKVSSENNDFLRRLYMNSLSNRDQTLATKQQQIDAVQKAIQSAESKQRSN